MVEAARAPAAAAQPARWLFLAIPLLLFCFAIPGYAVSFVPPPICKAGITGTEENLAEAGEEPLVWIRYKKGKNSRAEFISSIVVSPSQKGVAEFAGFAGVSGETSEWFMYVSYTPFLDGYKSLNPVVGGFHLESLPLPGTPDEKHNHHLFAQFTVTVTDSKGMAIPDAMVDFIPELEEFQGRSPFTIQADGKAQITILCFTYLGGFNRVTVSDKTGKYLFDGFIELTGRKDPNGQGQTVPDGKS